MFVCELRTFRFFKISTYIFYEHTQVFARSKHIYVMFIFIFSLDIALDIAQSNQSYMYTMCLVRISIDAVAPCIMYLLFLGCCAPVVLIVRLKDSMLV